MKLYLRISCMIEAFTGIALILLPVRLVSLIFNVPLEGMAGKMISLVAGVAILSLAFTCWLLINQHERAATAGLLFYNAVLFFILIYGMITYKITGPVMWLITVFHFVMALIAIILLKRKTDYINSR